MTEWPSQLPPEGWTESEKQLWIAFREGEELNLGGPNPVAGPPGAEYWGTERIIRATAISHLLINGPEQTLGKPPRLILKGARIEGWLDVGCAKLEAFNFIECIFDRSPFLNDATAIFVGFTRCTIPGLDAQRLKCAGPVWFHESRIFGQIDMEDSEIGGDLVLKEAVIESGKSETAVNLDGIRISSDLDMRAVNIKGAFRLNAARIDGYVWMSGAKLNNPNNWAFFGSQIEVGASIMASQDLQASGGLFLQGARISGHLVLDRVQISHPLETALHLDHSRIDLGLSCDNAHIRGSINLHHSIIGCQVSLEQTKIRDTKKNAIRADHMEVEGSVIFSGLEAVGEVDLHGAKIDCNLSLVRATLSGRDVALRADRAHIGNHLDAGKCSSNGAIQLTAIRVEGDTNFTDAEICNGTKDVLDLRRAVLNGSLAATGSFSAIGSINLTNTSISVDLRLSDAVIKNSRGRALAASGLRLAGDLIADRCTMEGLVDLAGSSVNGDLRLVDSILHGLSADESSRGSEVDTKGEWRGLSVRCTGSKINGDLDLRGARMTRELVIDNATVGRAVRLERAHLATEGSYALRADGLTAETLFLKPASQPIHGISLSSANVQEFADSTKSWPTDSTINISDFHYERLESDLPIADRLAWLKQATSTYSAGPYEKLAACLDLAGRDAEARAVRLASIRRSHQTKNLATRLWGSLQDAVIGYGYAPTRALLIFILLFVSASFWFSIGPVDCSASAIGLCPIKANEHPHWDPWLYSLDLLIPLVDLGHEKAWDPVGLSKLVMMTLVMSGWVLTTTVVTAASRTLRRS